MIKPTTPLSELPQYLTPAEAQTWLRIGRSSLYERLHDGTIESVKLGRLIRIPREALGKLNNGS